MVNLKLKISLILSLFIIGLFFQSPIIENRVAKSVVVFDKNQNVLTLGLTKDDKFRYWVNLKSVNKKFVSEIIEKEDRYFYYHFGVNPISFLRSSFYYFFTNKSMGGASTITMQLARLYFSLDTKGPLGKMNQVMHALYLEYRMSKKQILESYLNLIPMGRNIEGIETASLYLFQKKSEKLTKLERDFLLLLPQRPGLLSQFYKKNYKTLVTSLSSKYENLNEMEIEELVKSLSLSSSRPFYAPHFTRLLQSKSSARKIISTLDLKHQKNIQKIIDKYLTQIKDRGISNATLILVDTKLNEVVSYIGSADYTNNQIDGQVDGLLARRSPGSTLKPFIYAIAFEHGMLHAKSIVFDSPLPYRTPENYDRTYLGPISVEKALITSRNIPAVYINNELQKKNIGIHNLLNNIYPAVSAKKSHYGSSIALGALELSSIHLAQLYAMLANNGEFQHLKMYKGQKRNSKISFLSPESSIMIKDILSKHTRPNFGSSASFTNKKGDVYWKTGTSFGFRDAWAVGLWGRYALVTWVGDFRGKSNPYLVGSISAAPLFFKTIDYLRHEVEYEPTDELAHKYHDHLAEVEVCAVSGHLPNKFCDSMVKTLFIKNKSSIKKCQIHRRIKLAKNSNLRACVEYTGETYDKVYEFFTSDKMKVYAKHGLNLKVPPRYDDQCLQYVTAHSRGVKPLIISPKIGFTYISQKGSASIPLEARADSDSLRLSWYLDNELIKTSSINKITTISLNKGSHLLKVVDSFGREAQREVLVK
jgi:penicillin-binding protein 1C